MAQQDTDRQAVTHAVVARAAFRSLVVEGEATVLCLRDLHERFEHDWNQRFLSRRSIFHTLARDQETLAERFRALADESDRVRIHALEAADER